MGDTVHTPTTPSVYRKSHADTKDKDGRPEPGVFDKLRPIFDTELWTDLSAVIYSLNDTATIATTLIENFILSFEMPVDGRIEPIPALWLSYDGSVPLILAMRAAVVRRGDTPTVYGPTNTIVMPAPGAAWSNAISGMARALDVKAGKWDLWFQVENFATVDVEVELSLMMRRGRKPTS